VLLKISNSTESLHISIILLSVETEATFMKQADIHLKGTLQYANKLYYSGYTRFNINVQSNIGHAMLRRNTKKPNKLIITLDIVDFFELEGHVCKWEI